MSSEVVNVFPMIYSLRVLDELSTLPQLACGLVRGALVDGDLSEDLLRVQEVTLQQPEVRCERERGR